MGPAGRCGLRVRNAELAPVLVGDSHSAWIISGIANKRGASPSPSPSPLLSSPLSACHSFLIHRTAKVARLQNMAYFSHSHRMEMRSPFTGNVCLVLINGAAVVIKQGCVYILQQRDSSNSSCVYNGERDGTLKFII